MSEYRDIFLAELLENISLLNSTLIEVEKDSAKPSLLKDLVRAVHTIKGMAATMGYKNMTTLTHEIESHLMSIESVPGPIIQTLFSVADRLQQFHDVIIKDDDPDTIDVKDLLSELKSGGSSKAPKTKSKPAKTVQKAKPEAEIIKQGVAYKLEMKFKSQTRLLGARGFQAFRVIDSLAQISRSNPPIDVLEEGKLLGDIEMEIMSYDSEIEIRQALSTVEDVTELILTRLIDEAAPQFTDVTKGQKTRRTVQSVRVNLDKLDNVVDLLGELVITRGRFQSLVGSVSPEISEQLQIFDNTINNIQDTVMGLRMVNLSQIFDTYPRTVRDIAHTRGMDIDLLLQGTHIQIDRSVIDQVNEALIHLVRNAAIHGIEDEKDREGKGKSKTGRIRLSARRERGEVVLEVEDDGRGLDLESIQNKAIEMNLIGPEDELTRTQVASLIFRPGFSTAKEITDIAGRGVGMDIVKSTIDEISGTIEIRTRKNEGTLFVIRVQQTLAIVEALIVQVKGSDFAIPLLNVEKVFSSNDPAIQKHEGKEYLNWEGHNVRIIDLAQHLDLINIPVKNDVNGNGHTPAGRRSAKLREKVILWERANKRICLKVANVRQQREIVTKQLDHVYQKVDGILGATILGYDQVALILDPDSIERLS